MTCRALILVFLWAAITWNGRAQDTIPLPFSEDFESFSYPEDYMDTAGNIYNHWYFGGWEYCSQGNGTVPIIRWNGPAHHDSFYNSKVMMFYHMYDEENLPPFSSDCNGALLVTPWFNDRPSQVTFEVINKRSHGDSIELYDQIYVGTVNGPLPEVYTLYYDRDNVSYQDGVDFMYSTFTCGSTFVPYASITYERDEWRTITVDVSGLFEGQELPCRLAFRTIYCGLSDHLRVRNVFIDDISVSVVPYPISYDTVHYYDTICTGQLYDYHGFVLSEQQTDTVGEMVYSFVEYASGNDTTPTVNMLHLTIHDTSFAELYDTIIAGDCYSIADTLLTTSGTYSFSYVSSGGCDSTIVLHLSVLLRIDTVVYYDTLCEGDFYDNHGISIADCLEGEYTYEGDLAAPDGITHYILHLTVLGNASVVEEIRSLNGDTLFFLGQAITQPGQYTFSLPAANGCDSVITLIVEHETGRIDPSSFHICFGDSVLLTALGIHYIHWYSRPYDSSLATQQGAVSVMVSPAVSTDYYLLDVKGNIMARSRIEVEDCGWVWFPNVFMPDAESNNRFGCQTVLNVVSFELTIYNRVGLRVWESTDIDQQWDGTHKGIPVPQGAYVYFWRLKSAYRTYTGAGTVTLLH